MIELSFNYNSTSHQLYLIRSIKYEESRADMDELLGARYNHINQNNNKVQDIIILIIKIRSSQKVERGYD